MADHDPYSHDEEQDTERALSSYSDLFAAISFCFLFLYVVATLQSNIDHIQVQREHSVAQQQKIDAVIAKYEKMLAAHELEKDKYLASAQDKEKLAYEEALKNLHHLASQEEQRKQQLTQELGQAQVKAKALSDYQQLIKNIVDSNLALKQKVADKEQELEQNQIEFEKKTKDRYKGELKYQIKQAKLAIQQEFEDKLVEQEKTKLAQMKELEERYQREVASVRSEKARTQKEKAQLKADLAKLADERTAAIKNLETSHAAKVAQLENQFKAREGELQSENQKAHEKTKAAQLGWAKARAKDEIHKAIVKSLENEFAKNGISATIDRATGEVTLNFLKVYFDLGQSSLKAEMEADLAKFMPAYAKAIFSEKRNAEAIDHIEVIGFASPTYDKKYVDPSSLKAQNLDAVSYNLDLSFKRAKSIFKHIFDQKKLSYSHQDEIFKMTKVAGRSFLEGEAANGRFPASGQLSREEYCAQFDCKKQQKVVIKFHLKP